MTQIHWTSALSANFNTAAGWSGGVVPGAGDDAILDAGGANFTVTASTNETVASIQTAANATLAIAGGRFDATMGTASGVNAGVIAITAKADFLSGGTLTNTGAIVLAGGNGRRAHSRLVVEDSLTLTGGGTISLVPGHGDGIVKSAGGRATLTNIDNTISGAGFLGLPIGNASLAVTNEAGGVIDADISNANQGLRINHCRPSINGGLIEATNRGILLIFDTTFNNDGGMFEATGGGMVILGGGGTIVGGGIFAGAGSFVEAGGVGASEIAAITDSTLSTATGGTIKIGLGSNVATHGLITNAGSVVLGSSNGGATLLLDGQTSLTGGGVVASYRLNGIDSVIEGATSGAVLTNFDNVIRGSGELGAGSLTLINQAAGVIDADDGLLSIDTGVMTITNAGLTEATVGGIGLIASAIHNTGTVGVDGGTITVNGAVTGKVGTAVIDGGILDFTSTFNRTVSFTGTSGELELALSQRYSGTIKGFSKTGGTSLDLVDIAFVSSSEATYSGDKKSGVLTVTDGTHIAQIHLRGDYLSSTFTASGDGHGGTIVVASTPGAATHRFIAAASAFGAPNAAPMGLAHEARRLDAPMLARPAMRVA